MTLATFDAVSARKRAALFTVVATAPGFLSAWLGRDGAGYATIVNFACPGSTRWNTAMGFIVAHGIADLYNDFSAPLVIDASGSFPS